MHLLGSSRVSHPVPLEVEGTVKGRGVGGRSEVEVEGPPKVDVELEGALWS